MKLIEDLGMQFATANSTRKNRYGLFECPVCLVPFKCILKAGISGRTTKCRECGYKSAAVLNSEKAALSFVAEASVVHGDRYNYSLVEYKNNTTPVKIICKVHDVFLQRPSDHKDGHGCPHCSGNARNTTDNFIKECTSIHMGKYDYSLVNYKNNRASITIICSKHGEFEQVADSHKQGSGCQECAKENNSIATRMFSTDKTTLYYVYLKDYNLWKIGCTRRTIKERFKGISVEILDTVTFSLGGDAYRLEQLMLQSVIGIRYAGEPIMHKGNTELITKSIDFAKVLGNAYVTMLQSQVFTKSL